MAESKVKSVFEKEVTCPLCLDVFKEPKKLPCDHVYCKECIKALALRSLLNATISCPECCTLTQLPNNNVDNLPTDFRMNRFIEAFQKMKIGEETDSSGTKVDTSLRCEVHPAQLLAIYCETCMKVLCRDCVLVTKDHDNHEYGFMKDKEEKVRNKLELHISKIQAQAEGISSSLEKIRNADMVIDHCETQCQLEIDQTFESLINEIEERKQVIKKSTAEQFRLLSSGYVKQKEELKAAQAELQESITLATTSLKDPVVKFLSNQESTNKKFDHVESKFQLSVSRPQLLMVKVSDTPYQFEKYVTVQQQMDPIQWDLMKSLPKSIPLGQQYTFNIVTRADKRFWKKGFQERNYKFNIALHCVRDGSEITREAKQLSADRVAIFIAPQSRGRHKLSVTLSGLHISNSPFDIFVYNPRPVREIPNLRGVVGLTLIDNKLIATEMNGNQIVYIDSDFCPIALPGVNGITRDSECNLYATTGERAPCLHKFTRNGIHIKSSGKYGTANGQFLYSNGPRVSKSNELYVCDSKSSRVQVFDLDLNFKRTFGKGEKGMDHFNWPADIDFDAAGNVYVTDPWNNRIQVFDSRGHYIHSIGSSHLTTPASLFIRDELIYTTEHQASRISVLTTSGQLVTNAFGSGYISEPNGMTVGQDGLVYVTSKQSKIFVF